MSLVAVQAEEPREEKVEVQGPCSKRDVWGPVLGSYSYDKAI